MRIKHHFYRYRRKYLLFLKRSIAIALVFLINLSSPAGFAIMGHDWFSSFVYANEPTISSISPSSGTTGGGTLVTISGTNLTTGAPATTNIYGRTVTITNPSGSTLTDYQVLVEFDSQSLIAAGKMKSDGSDIRVLSGDGSTVLSHWLDTGTIDTASTDVWVKVPSIPTSGATIMLTYGDDTLTTTSSGDNTFEFFDDFEDGVIDTTKWNIIGSTANITEANGYLTISNNGGTSYELGTGVVAKNYSGGPGVRLDTTIRDMDGVQVGTVLGSLSPSNTAAYISSLGLNQPMLSIYQLGGYLSFPTTETYGESYGTTRLNTTMANTGATTSWSVYGIEYLSTSVSRYYKDGTLHSTHTGDQYVPDIPLYPALGATDHYGGTGNTQQHDLIKVRKILNTPPTLALGVEESVVSADVTFGGQTATEITVVDATTLTARTPAHAAVTVDVVVTIGGSPLTLSNAFTYAAPQITSVNPTAGRTGGGTQVTISGDYFFSGAVQADTSLDFDTAQEGDFIQQDAANNTDFTNDAVTLHSAGGQTTTDATDTRVWQLGGTTNAPNHSDNDTATRTEWVGTFSTIDLGTAKSIWKFRLFTNLEG